MPIRTMMSSTSRVSGLSRREAKLGVMITIEIRLRDSHDLLRASYSRRGPVGVEYGPMRTRGTSRCPAEDVRCVSNVPIHKKMSR